MSGPTELIRQNCPIATSGNDGIMSAEQAATVEAAGAVSVTGNAAISAGALIKASSVVAGRYETLGAADAASLMVGVAVTACSGAASPFTAQFVPGTVTTMLSDGTGTIGIGAAVEPSTTVAGRIKAGTTNVVGNNIGALVAATLNATVSVL
jgi:hypothetical protein